MNFNPNACREIVIITIKKMNVEFEGCVEENNMLCYYFWQTCLLIFEKEKQDNHNFILNEIIGTINQKPQTHIWSIMIKVKSITNQVITVVGNSLMVMPCNFLMYIFGFLILLLISHIMHIREKARHILSTNILNNLSFTL